jgi:phage terminase Nu1 subunit (DNA packaging protein)
MAEALTGGIVTRRAVAQLFGVNMMTVTKWEQAGMPIHFRGTRGRPSLYSMPECIKWFAEREVRARGGQGEGRVQVSPLEQRAMLDAKRTEDLDLRIRVRKGELIEVDEAARDLANVATATKARIRRIPDAVADKLVSAAVRGASAVRTLLLDEIDDALRELAAHGETTEDAA